MTDRERTAVQLREDLAVLIGRKILDEKSANRLIEYYPLPARRDYRKRLVVCFGVLGAFLIGGGLTMIVAHHWDRLSLAGRLAAAYLPLFFFWSFGGWVLARRGGSAVRRESASILILASLAGAVGIVSQQYHSSGTLGELTVILLGFGIFLIYFFVIGFFVVL